MGTVPGRRSKQDGSAQPASHHRDTRADRHRRPGVTVRDEHTERAGTGGPDAVLGGHSDTSRRLSRDVDAVHGEYLNPIYVDYSHGQLE